MSETHLLDPSQYQVTEKIIEPRFDADENTSVPSEPPHLLILLHGIRTKAEWVNTLIQEGILSGELKVESVYYGVIGTKEFLEGRIDFRVYSDIYNQISDILDAYQSYKISVFCHSFGTKLFSELCPMFKTKFHYVFLEGGITRPEIAQNISKSCTRLINDCGNRDMWPICAEIIRPSRYQASGYYGFGTHWARDRFFEYDHAGYLTKEHFKNYIIPTIINNDLIQLKFETRKAPHWIIRYTRRLAIPFIGALAGLAYVIYLYLGIFADIAFIIAIMWVLFWLYRRFVS